MELNLFTGLYALLRFEGKVKNQVDFANQLSNDDLSIGRSYISLLLAGAKPITDEIAERVNKLYPEELKAAAEKLRKKQVDYLKETEAQSTSEPTPNYHTARMERKGGKRLTQFYDAPATASDVDSDMVPITQPAGYIDTGELFGQCEAAIRIRGNSMLSGYPSGTILGLNRDHDKFFEPGELYVLETRSKRLFKRLFYHPEDPNIIICHSDNEDRFSKGVRAGSPFYPDFPVHMEDVVRRFIVVGSAREHSNSMLLYANPVKDANSEDEIHVLSD